MSKVTALHDEKLTPETSNGGELVNADTVILMAKEGLTPEAKFIYRRYLHHRRKLERLGQIGSRARAEALFAALRDSGADVQMLKP